MNRFEEMDLVQAYTMLSGRKTAVLATKGLGVYNLTPYGWFMPMDYEPVTKVIVSSDPAHQADANIRRTKEFALCLPETGEDNADWIESCGSVSSPEADKFKMFHIEGIKASKIDAMIPAGLLSGWIECRLIKIIREGSVDLIMGQAVAAFVKKR
ncbi:MAG: flavin reductase family protein [Treponema sp.]